MGDAPEGLAIGPRGDLAVPILLKGSAAVPKDAWFANPAGSVVTLRIDSRTKQVTRGEEIAVGRLPEGAVFSPDGQHLYVGNFPDRTISILALDQGRLVDTGQTLVLPGKPAAMRGPLP